MVTETPLCNFGWKAVDFRLKGIDERVYVLGDVRRSNGTLVMFICNHCPHVRAIIDRVVCDVRELQKLEIGAIAIMSNDTVRYPEDSFENMKIFASQHNFSFPYVIDESQEVARAYGAACTPDFFGFNSDLELQYRGCLNTSSKETGKLNVRRDLFEAMQIIAYTGRGPTEQFPSIGCSLKWR